MLGSRRTPDEARRIEVTKHAIGCMPCLLRGWYNVQADYHHVVKGMRRLGHMYGYGMCLWHHKGELDPDYLELSLSEVRDRIGPSYAAERKKFIEEFGDEMDLVDTNTFAVRLWMSDPWNDFSMPHDKASRIQTHHRVLRSTG